MKSSEDRPQALREMLIRGEESGIAEYSYKEFIAELDEKTHEVKHAQQWLDQNKKAIAVYNKSVNEIGVFSDWLRLF